VNEILNLPEVENVYLHDKTTDDFYDIKNGFHELSLAAGTTNTRYEITFKNNTLSNDEFIKNDIVLFHSNSEKTVKVNNLMQKELNSINFYDITGRLIYQKMELGNESSFQFSTSNFTDGIYIVKLIAENQQEINQKIIVKN
jgi:hypothetical protein